MVDFLRTSAVAERLGVPAGQLYNAVRRGRIPEPPRDSSGQLAWFANDVDSVREYVEAKRICNRRFPAPEKEDQK
jgi:predicted DNA-binding transcriptional regulator AlpA